ncbi:hypothetical protein BDN72DRAFT_862654 [Pluteus cervinus]|uniref:Uncharacterized protein n=1 Tax=Pluteus cervinus TaxID=181527 RepID=A0ACD3AAE8_9AGAR|nr:hypothetical protein BDN72DRAFT_862654 [Pluteus cervinus]
MNSIVWGLGEMVPGRNSEAVIMGNHASRLAERYGPDPASDAMARSQSNLHLNMSSPHTSYFESKRVYRSESGTLLNHTETEEVTRTVTHMEVGREILAIIRMAQEVGEVGRNETTTPTPSFGGGLDSPTALTRLLLHLEFKDSVERSTRPMLVWVSNPKWGIWLKALITPSIPTPAPVHVKVPWVIARLQYCAEYSYAFSGNHAVSS